MRTEVVKRLLTLTKSYFCLVPTEAFVTSVRIPLPSKKPNKEKLILEGFLYYLKSFKYGGDRIGGSNMKKDTKWNSKFIFTNFRDFPKSM